MDTPPPDERLAAVVALKTLPTAKTRLATLPGPLRERLARCMALDTLAALAPAVHHLLVISDQPDLSPELSRLGLRARVVAEPQLDRTAPDGKAGDSLNRALAYGDALLRADGVTRVLACVGDLPALRTETVVRVLTTATSAGRSFLPDHDGRGTTMLIADGEPLGPLFGTGLVAGRLTGSAARHRRSGAAALSLDSPDARWDVDTIDDLQIAHELGLGPATGNLLDPGSGAVGRYALLTVRERTAEVIIAEIDGQQETVPWSAYDGDPALIVPGRRLHAVRVAGALRCWG